MTPVLRSMMTGVFYLFDGGVRNGKEKTALGLIVLAEVDSVVEGDFRFISEDEIDSLTGKMVDSFQDNARRAFQLYRK